VTSSVLRQSPESESGEEPPLETYTQPRPFTTTISSGIDDTAVCRPPEETTRYSSEAQSRLNNASDQHNSNFASVSAVSARHFPVTAESTPCHVQEPTRLHPDSRDLSHETSQSVSPLQPDVDQIPSAGVSYIDASTYLPIFQLSSRASSVETEEPHQEQEDAYSEGDYPSSEVEYPRSESSASWSYCDLASIPPIEDDDMGVSGRDYRSIQHPSVMDGDDNTSNEIERWREETWELRTLYTTLVEKGKDFDTPLQYPWCKAITAWSQLAFSQRNEQPASPVSDLL
jgi:hypothetical protein